MAPSTMAREQLFALRQKIARIEGTQPERLEGGALDRDENDVLVRKHAPASAYRTISTGVAKLDRALGGGLPLGALTEITGKQTRDSAAAAGFAMGLAALAAKEPHNERPLLWIGLEKLFHEAGLPYTPGFWRSFGFSPQRFLLVQPKRTEDALWAAEEAAIEGGFAAIVLELYGSPSKLNLTATRRLHHRARIAGYPLFLIRHAGEADATAAPTRFAVSATASSFRETLAGPVSRSIGPPALTIALTKSRTGNDGAFVLEWNAHDFTFQERSSRRGNPLHGNDQQTSDYGNLVAVSVNRSHPAPAARPALENVRHWRETG